MASIDIFDDYKRRYFKRRIQSRGPFVPVMAWLQRGDRNENNELEDDEKYMLVWWPHMQNRSERHFLDFWQYVEINQIMLEEIEKEEFEWLMTLKDL